MTSKQGKHTPGKWRVSPDCSRGLQRYEVHAGLDLATRRIARCANEHDAKLISLAPEMLEALRSAIPHLAHNNLGHGEHCDNTCPKCAAQSILSQLDTKEG